MLYNNSQPCLWFFDWVSQCFWTLHLSVQTTHLTAFYGIGLSARKHRNRSQGRGGNTDSQTILGPRVIAVWRGALNRWSSPPPYINYVDGLPWNIVCVSCAPQPTVGWLSASYCRAGISVDIAEDTWENYGSDSFGLVSVTSRRNHGAVKRI